MKGQVLPYRLAHASTDPERLRRELARTAAAGWPARRFLAVYVGLSQAALAGYLVAVFIITESLGIAVVATVLASMLAIGAARALAWRPRA